MKNSAELFEELLSVEKLTVNSAYSDALDYDEQMSHYVALVQLTVALNKVIGNHNELIKLYNELNSRFDGATFTVGTGDITTSKLDDGAVTVAKLSEEVFAEIDKIATKNFERNGGTLRDSGRKNRPMISFIDDDCRSPVYERLYNEVLDPEGTGKSIIPYAIACPHLSIGDEGYLTYAQLKKMYSAGVSITCHTDKEYNMTQYNTEQEFIDMLERCFAEYKEWGINDVIAYCYCQGIWKPEYMNIVKRYFKLGFVVEPGINEVPIESYYMKRVEVFIKNRTEGVTEEEIVDRVENVVKNYINDVAENGGWLVLMTHAWYDSFRPGMLADLIEYIRGKGIDIVSIEEGLKSVGNIIETGTFKKPVEDNTEPFFVVGADGRAWSNKMDMGVGSFDGTVVELTVMPKMRICSSTWPNNPLRGAGDQYYVVSEPVDVTDCKRVRINGYATYNESAGCGDDVYAFLDANGRCVGAYEATVPWNQGGTTLFHHDVDVPADAVSIVIAGYSNNGMMPGLGKYNVTGEDAIKQIGSLSELNTVAKGSVVDAINEIYSLLTTGDRPTGEQVVAINVGGYETGKYLNANGKSVYSTYVAGSAEPMNRRKVSYAFTVDHTFKKYILTCSAINGNALFAFWDGNKNPINGFEVDGSGNTAGTVLTDFTVDVPSNAAYLIVSCNEILQPNGITVKGVTG